MLTVGRPVKWLLLRDSELEFAPWGLLASRLLSTRHNSLRNAAQDKALSTYLILSLRSQQGKSILSCCLILFMGYKKSA